MGFAHAMDDNDAAPGAPSSPRSILCTPSLPKRRQKRVAKVVLPKLLKCPACNGKRTTSTGCLCNPKPCKRCSGSGYEILEAGKGALILPEAVEYPDYQKHYQKVIRKWWDRYGPEWKCCVLKTWTFNDEISKEVKCVWKVKLDDYECPFRGTVKGPEVDILQEHLRPLA